MCVLFKLALDGKIERHLPWGYVSVLILTSASTFWKLSCLKLTWLSKDLKFKSAARTSWMKCGMGGLVDIFISIPTNKSFVYCSRWYHPNNHNMPKLLHQREDLRTTQLLVSHLLWDASLPSMFLLAWWWRTCSALELWERWSTLNIKTKWNSSGYDNSRKILLRWSFLRQK